MWERWWLGLVPPCLFRMDMMKYPAYGSSCVISNKLIVKRRPCLRTRLWQPRLSRASGTWLIRRHMLSLIARTRAQSEDFARAELTAVQRFEDSLQRQSDGQLRSRVRALRDECRDHVGQEEDKMRKELQHTLTQESSMYRDQLQQTWRR